MRDGRRGLRGDVWQLDAGDADGDAGGGVCVHELGRGVQRDEHDDGVPVDAAKTCWATFTATAPTYSLTIAPVPTGGTVTGSGLTCGTGGAACAVTLAARRRRR